MKKSFVSRCLLILFTFQFSALALASNSSTYSLYGQWPSNNNLSNNLDVSTSDTILNVNNVNKLVPIWNILQNGVNGDGAGVAVQSTPTIADGNVYIATSGGKLFSYTEAGKLNWSVQLYDDQRNNENFAESPVLTQNSVFIAGRQMHAVNLANGKPIWATVWDPNYASVIPSGDLLPSQVMVAGNLVVYGVTFADEDNGNVSLFPYDHGEIVAFHQDTGATAWRVDFTKVNGIQYGGGSGTFGNFAVDESRQLLFVGTSEENVPPVSPLSDSLVAINYTTGNVVWSYQFVANDYWNASLGAPNPPGTQDLDVGGHPQIFSVQLIPGVPASNIDLVGESGKDGTYRIFTRDQSNPNNVQPIAQIQLDPGSAFIPIGVTPVILNGTLYIASAAWLQDLTKPNIHTTLDEQIYIPPFDGFVTTLRSIDLRQLIYYGVAQQLLGNTQPICLGTFIPSACTGRLPNSIINWQATYQQVAPYTSSGMLYDNGFLAFSDGTYGNVLIVNAANGQLISEIPSQSEAGMFGGVSADNGKLFIPYGFDYAGSSAPPGGITVFGLPTKSH